MLRLRFFSGIFFAAWASQLLWSGCGSTPDATGEAGIGAPGKPPATVLSDEEAHKLQLQQEADMLKAAKQK